MAKCGFLFSVIITLTIFLNTFSNAQTIMKSLTMNIHTPVADKIPHNLETHGHKRIDNYFWMNKRDDPKVIDYLNKENEYLEKMMKETEEFQIQLFEEIIGRIKQDDSSVPYFANGYYYYSRFEEGKDFPVYCRKKSKLESDEEILLDVNKLAEGYKYYHVAGLSVSPDNRILAFSVDTLSRRKYDIHFKNLETGETLEEKIANTTGSSTWAEDNKTLFYTLKDHTLRSYKIMMHKFGSSSEEDMEVYHEEDETFSTFVFKSKSRKYIIIGSRSTLSDEYRVIEARKPDGNFRIIHPRERNLEYSLDHLGNSFFIRTNLDAKNFRLVGADENNTSKDNWKEILSHREDVLLERFELFNDYIVVQERKNGLNLIRIIDRENNSEHLLDFGEEAYSAFISVNREPSFEALRYQYNSLTTPNSTIEYNMRTKEKTVLKMEEVLGGFDPADYHTERLFAPSHDGTMVPISLVYKKGINKDGSNPLLLYGYGSYGISTNPTFNSARLSLLNRGFIFAIAHVRGGQELGRQWYEDGKLLKKKNTFYDFIACAEFLIRNKYTSESNLFASGGSAGGLLMGAVVNLRPDLFKGIIASVPFVDVVTTMLDESIPLTTSEYDEWGNPNIKEYYNYMLSYSPYDNIEEKDYPAMLVLTGYHDSQVQYWEPAKWVAKLRNLKTDNNPLLFKTDMDTGHSGSAARFKKFREIALEYTFLLDIADRAVLTDNQ